MQRQTWYLSIQTGGAQRKWGQRVLLERLQVTKKITEQKGTATYSLFRSNHTARKYKWEGLYQSSAHTHGKTRSTDLPHLSLDSKRDTNFPQTRTSQPLRELEVQAARGPGPREDSALNGLWRSTEGWESRSQGVGSSEKEVREPSSHVETRYCNYWTSPETLAGRKNCRSPRPCPSWRMARARTQAWAQHGEGLYQHLS